MKIFILFLVIAFPTLTFAKDEAAANNKAILDLMVTAKATGMCGVFSQMVNFQDATKMPGGDEFIVRFLNTEAARLGYSLEGFMEGCPKIVSKYKKAMELFGGM